MTSDSLSNEDRAQVLDDHLKTLRQIESKIADSDSATAISPANVRKMIAFIEDVRNDIGDLIGRESGLSSFREDGGATFTGSQDELDTRYDLASGQAETIVATWSPPKTSSEAGET